MSRLSIVAMGLVAGVVFVASTTCGGSHTAECVVNQSISCVGVGGCSGFQTCKSDRTFDACDCSAYDAGFDSGLTDAAPEAGAADAGDANGGADSGPWSPSNLSNLVLWLDDTVGAIPDKVRPGHLLRWLDQSGKGNDAETVNYPDELTIDPAAVNGHDAYVNNNLTWLGIADGPDFQWGTGDFCVGMVARLGYNPQGFRLWNKPNVGPDFQLSTSSFGNVAAGTNIFVTLSVPATSTFHIIIARGAKLELRVDGQLATGGSSTADISAKGADVAIFQAGNSDANEIAEVIAVKGAVSNAEVLALQAYWQKKFKL